MTQQDTRPRTYDAAMIAWPDQVEAVWDDPTTAELDQLCTLLDVIDAAVVARWGTKGHEVRRAALEACRADARDANHLVTVTLAASAKATGARAMAARVAKEARKAPAST